MKLLIRAVCQIKRGDGFSLLIWDKVRNVWEIDRDVHPERHPAIPLREEGWVFQYLRDEEWKPHGVFFSPEKAPSEELFAECA